MAARDAQAETISHCLAQLLKQPWAIDAACSMQEDANGRAHGEEGVGSEGKPLLREDVPQDDASDVAGC